MKISRNLSPKIKIGKKGKKEPLVKNQFNYQDRGSQTGVQPPRNKLLQTDPPPRVEIRSSVSQWEIYDYYQKHLQQVQAEKEKVILENFDYFISSKGREFQNSICKV